MWKCIYNLNKKKRMNKKWTITSTTESVLCAPSRLTSFHPTHPWSLSWILCSPHPCFFGWCACVCAHNCYVNVSINSVFSFTCFWILCERFDSLAQCCFWNPARDAGELIHSFLLFCNIPWYGTLMMLNSSTIGRYLYCFLWRTLLKMILEHVFWYTSVKLDSYVFSRFLSLRNH